MKIAKYIELNCEYCGIKIVRTEGDINKRIKRRLEHTFCYECAIEYGRNRFKKWNKENNKKDWHKQLSPNGYFRVTIETNDKKMIRELQHRYIVEQSIGRELKKEEIVHRNNNIENLMVTDRFKHMALHK